MRLLDKPTRSLFFTGKGGVGKTSTSAPLRVLADRGKTVRWSAPIPLQTWTRFSAPGWALSRHPSRHRAAAPCTEHRPKPLPPNTANGGRPVSRILPVAAVASIEELVAGACTVEIAAFDEFAKLIANPKSPRRTTISCLTPRQPGTRCGCCRCPLRGAASFPAVLRERSAFSPCRPGRTTRTSMPRQ